jgi:hypothetical protein
MTIVPRVECTSMVLYLSQVHLRNGKRAELSKVQWLKILKVAVTFSINLRIISITKTYNMKSYDESYLKRLINEAVKEQNHFWWGCVIGMQYGKLSVKRVGQDEELAYCVDTEEAKAKTFMPIVRVKYGSPYKGQSIIGHVVCWYSKDHEPVNVSYLRYKSIPEVYETGATKHHINSLILFTDNTRSLIELRDSIYNSNINETKLNPEVFEPLCDNARYSFIRENGYEPVESKPIDKMRYKKNHADVLEYCQIFANGFENWKIDHQ